MSGTVRRRQTLLPIAAVILMVLSLGFLFAEPAWAEGAGSPAECKTGVGAPGGDDVRQFTAAEGEIVEGVCIKSGANMFQPAGHSGVLGNGTYENGCYEVTGVGTQTATVTRLGSGSDCQALSHVDVVVGEEEPRSGYACVDGEVEFIEDVSDFDGRWYETPGAVIDNEEDCAEAPPPSGWVCFEGKAVPLEEVSDSEGLTVYETKEEAAEDPGCEEQVGALVLVTVTGQCVVENTVGTGRITVDMSVDGAATVVIEDSDDAVVATVTESSTITVPEGATYSWSATPGEDFVFPVDFDASGEVAIETCSGDEVLASVLVTVSGQCVVDGSEGIGRITVDMSVDGAATVVVEDSDGAVVGTLTESATITVPEGDTYSWSATPAEGFEFPVDFDASGDVQVASCSEGGVLPFTGLDAEGFGLLALAIISAGLLFLVAGRTIEH